MELVKTIIRFRRDLKFYFEARLSKELFDDLIQYYMYDALAQSGFADQFRKEMERHEECDRKWDIVQMCLNKVLKFEALRGSNILTLFSVKPKEGENHITFCERVEMLHEAAEAGQMSREGLFIEALVANLPDHGREKIREHFGSSRDIKSERELLDFIRQTPTILQGPTTDPCAYYKDMVRRLNNDYRRDNVYQRGDKRRGRPYENRDHSSDREEKRDNRSEHQ
jgi:hypothetical protein